MTTNTSVAVTKIVPMAGASNEGYKVGYIKSGAKAAQNDTWTVGEATTVIWASVTLDSTGVHDSVTISTNVITLTGAGTGASSGIVIYK